MILLGNGVNNKVRPTKNGDAVEEQSIPPSQKYLKHLTFRF